MPVLSQTPWGLSHRARRCGGADLGPPCQEGSTDPTDLLRGREAPAKPPGRAGAFSKCHMSWSTRKGQEWGVGAYSLCRRPEMPRRVCRSGVNARDLERSGPQVTSFPGKPSQPSLMSKSPGLVGALASGPRTVYVALPSHPQQDKGGLSFKTRAPGQPSVPIHASPSGLLSGWHHWLGGWAFILGSNPDWH